jgi:hypothetical protein
LAAAPSLTPFSLRHLPRFIWQTKAELRVANLISGQLNPKTNPKSMTKSKDPAWKNCYWPGLNKMMKSTWLKMMNKYMILVNPHVTALLKMVRKLMQSWMILILMIFEQFSLSAFC